ncbi:MAG TPA: RDD family protein [Allocoleopsis sp.]|uniref:RDD family protein n=1 Tax=Geitlerinema sp. PCC 7407 TaxID=1173025 RepID=UPI00029FBF04|nr:RDD family protein [Geitlerinema sp. PCC 7407]AFY66342.1 RDD domain containing protein [Geitlerinema sp. PCC 7407]
MPQASFLQRLLAWLIDQAILIILYSLAMFIIGLAIGVYKQSQIQIPNLILFIGLIGFLFVLWLEHFLYFGYFWSHRERSIGMGMMSIRVVKADHTSLSFIGAGLRGSIGYYLSGLIFCLGYLWFFIDEQQQTWHDKIFNTVVLKG